MREVIRDTSSEVTISKTGVYDKPKVGLANTRIRDRIYAGDLESMDYSGSGLYIQVYDASGVFVGEYDVPWSETTRSALAYSALKEAAIEQVSDWSTQRQGEELKALLEKSERSEYEEILVTVLQGDRPPYTYAQWEYTIPRSSRP